MRFLYKAVFLAFLLHACLALTQTAILAPDLRAKIDDIARQTLAATGTPSASIAVVRDGQIAYLQAYGDAQLEPRIAARTEMRYSIGSISKQFTAAALLLLAEQGKLSLDDPVSRFVPNLTRANEVTIRQVLSHTAGYQDYWPQDYVPPFMLQPVTAEKILDRWARKPLDYEPGTEYQYSNTGFVIAGEIVEKASGMALIKFLYRHIFSPLAMHAVIDVDDAHADPIGYQRFGLGPLRPAPKEGAGWLFAAGELAMPAEDLAKWDLSLINQSLLKPASYQEMETTRVLKNGLATDYGLGVGVSKQLGHRAISHGGEVSGFTAQNKVFPDDGVAIVVLTNQDAVGTPGDIARKIAPLLFTQENAAAEEGKARKIFDGLQRSEIDRSLFTENANSYFTQQALHDLAGGLAPLGAPLGFSQTARSERGGMTFRSFTVTFRNQTLEVTQRTMPDGKIEQYQVSIKE